MFVSRLDFPLLRGVFQAYQSAVRALAVDPMRWVPQLRDVFNLADVSNLPYVPFPELLHEAVEAAAAWYWSAFALVGKTPPGYAPVVTPEDRVGQEQWKSRGRGVPLRRGSRWLEVSPGQTEREYH